MTLRSIVACFLLLVLSLTVGCSAPEGNGDHTTDVGTESEAVQIQTRPPVADNTAVDLDGRKIEILARNDGAEVEFENVRDGSLSILGEAVYRRNITVQTRLN